MDMRMLAQVQKMQKELQKKQAEFAAKEFEVDYKNGSVVVNITGAKKITGLKINPALIDPEDPITLQEMVVEAINSAVEQVKAKADEIQNSMMPSGMGGLGGLF